MANMDSNDAHIGERYELFIIPPTNSRYVAVPILEANSGSESIEDCVRRYLLKCCSRYFISASNISQHLCT